MPVQAVRRQYRKTCFNRAAVPTHRLRLAAAILALAVAMPLAGCQSSGLGDITGSIGGYREPTLPTSEPELRRFVDDWGHKYDRDPNNKRVAMTYAHALRVLGEHQQAVAVLQRLAAKYPKDMEVLGGYGKALADVGRLAEAADVLARAHTPERPNWSILSAQGSVADQLGDHVHAQEYYAAALKIVPNQPQVLSNLGLSYALSNQLPHAEATLQQAVAQPGADMRVRQNLALVLALEGKFKSAQDVSERDLAPIDAASNVASIRQMIAQSDTWKEIRKLDKTKQARAISRDGQTRRAAEVAQPAADPRLTASSARD